jgi:hypothetical protein
MRKIQLFTLIAIACSLSVHAQELQATVQSSFVQLKWAPADLTSIDHYEIERRSVGGEFKTIALVLAEPETNAAYVYKDKMTGGEQHLYYRIHFYHLDGTDGYSDILSLNLDQAKEQLLNISTDVAGCRLLMDLPEEKGSYLFRIYNMNGQLLETQRSDAGTNAIAADKLTAGKYFMEAYHPQSGKRFYGTFSL